MDFNDPDDSPLTYSCAANDGGIKRGDSAETGDDEARPTAGAEPEDETESLGQSDLDDLTVLDADDPTLGLTDIDAVPPEDWAADTGPTRSAEERDRVAWDQLRSRPEHSKPVRKG